MPRQTNSSAGFPADLLVDVRDGAGRGIRERLETALRRGIQAGMLKPGSSLPPTRSLAADLAIARSVVVEVYGDLIADGYLEARPGAGTWVRSDLRSRGGGSPRDAVPGSHPGDLGRDRLEYQPRRRPRPRPGSPAIRLFGGLPDPALFPRRTWLRHYRAALSEVPDPELTYPEMLGASALRAALATYLGRVRGVSTETGRIVICSGFTQGLTLVCRALRRRGGRRLAVEDPCFAHHRVAVSMAGLEPVPVPVDRDGIDPAQLPANVAGVVLAPAHSYPSGATLGSERRHEVIAWARERDAFVIEDDYDAEFRYDRKPIGALQGLAPSHVVYIGCASKTVTPALRLGWAAVPARLVDELELEKLYDDMGSTLPEQLAFARFIDSGDFARYLRHVRPIYRRRRDATLNALASHLPSARPQGEDAGLHLHVLLPEHLDEIELAAAAFDRGVLVEDGAWHWARPDEAPPSIVLGYGASSEPAITRGVALLGAAATAVG